MIQRTIPSSGEQLPVIGIGTWQTFDVPGTVEYPRLTGVLDTLKQQGGSLIDTSPMYGNAEKVIGDITCNMPQVDEFFFATKVWTEGRLPGIRQMQSSMEKLQRKTIDLMQIHNLVDWKTHLQTLNGWKEEGRVKYIGITHYTDLSHETLEEVIKSQKIDFVQFNYSISARNAEKSLFNTASDHGVATIINRPFGEGKLFSTVKDKPLPDWAKENGILSWASYFLKFIISHPAVTCVIPATGNIDHEKEILTSVEGNLPDETLRSKMISYLDGL